MGYAVRGEAIQLHGFTELVKAFERIEGGRGNYGIEYELEKRLRAIGEKIAEDAPGYVTHATGRGSGELERSVKVSVTKKQVAVYSTSEYGGVQNVGGGPHAGWSARGPHVRKDRASKWMIKAVQANREFTQEQLDGILEWVGREFERLP